MRLVWTEQAWDDYLYWQATDRKVLQSINDLIKDCRIEQSQAVRGRCRSFGVLFGNLGDDKLKTSWFR